MNRFAVMAIAAVSIAIISGCRDNSLLETQRPQAPASMISEAPTIEASSAPIAEASPTPGDNVATDAAQPSPSPDATTSPIEGLALPRYENCHYKLGANGHVLRPKLPPEIKEYLFGAYEYFGSFAPSKLGAANQLAESVGGCVESFWISIKQKIPELTYSASPSPSDSAEIQPDVERITDGTIHQDQYGVFRSFFSDKQPSEGGLSPEEQEQN
ncbi:MAG: hypothetical protein WAN50_04490 [Minisyncoccia bacterium]